MKKIIKSMSNKYMEKSLELVEKVFTEFEDKESGILNRELVKEIRDKKYYLPELELIMVNEENDEVIGYAMFSAFHLDGRYSDILLMLTPVAVKTELQRQHISKELIEHGFQKAIELGYKAVIVEGNPQNYQSRGFKTSADYGIIAGESIDLPAPECFMVKELVPNALDTIHGKAEYTDYATISLGGAYNE